MPFAVGRVAPIIPIMCDRPNRKYLALAVGLALGTAAAAVFALGKPQGPAKETAHLQNGTNGNDAGAASEPLIADRVIVHKAERRLYLMRGDTVLRSYRVALGLNPVGPKEQEGDSRTPEGHYQLTRRNPRSEYFLSIQVSYPNDKDMQRARRNRLTPGGSIMIHGLPNELRREPAYYEQRDWTDGCIAVSDSDMLEIWLMTPQDIPIDILP
jgi:L,D-peptidoglycan transpeptidase YkuD (ErfK/YbiS/YcfS/YnhG family)